ncbi:MULTISPECIES: hypothetical protein [unclassified Bradyrhizobium]|uniref:hypothetical protein n=1 Tax=unclassified Bradyrhizobium TaxID=2631580 RepID=UPI0029166B58|nr:MULTISPECIES: hypothetical protein [unclassified Bradyrhizobium]
MKPSSMDLENKPWSRTTAVAFAVLAALFWLEIAWFNLVDPYEKHYFDAGLIMVLHQGARLVSMLLMGWLVYATGAGLLALLPPIKSGTRLLATDIALLGFAFGCFIWHVVMLGLGLASLYYRPLLAAVAFVVIALSSPHAAAVAGKFREAWPRLQLQRPGRLAAVIVMSFVALWLLTLKSLYPGGGGDFYTHYFPYAVAVLKNHGLVPNDVWYHFYYSKGDGLFFLAMLLTDPMAQPLVTSIFVAFAALAVGDLTNRLIPNSLWPLCAMLAYLLLNAVNMNPTGGGEFQKSHEVVAALVTLMAWALCRHRTEGAPIFIAMASACAATIAIVNLPVGAILSFVFALLGAPALLSRSYRRFWQMFAAGAFVALTAASVLALNQGVTGLASDQALGATLKIADFARLDRRGLLPQIVSLAWMHDNLDDLAPPFGWDDISRLAEYMRVFFLWPLLVAPGVVLLGAILNWLLFLRSRRAPRELAHLVFDYNFALDSRGSIIRLCLVIGLFAVVLTMSGRAQNISAFRASSFFVPLLIMLDVALVAWLLSLPVKQLGVRLVHKTILPVAGLIGCLITWQVDYYWAQQFLEGAANGLRLLSGRYSLATAYERHPLGTLAVGLRLGGIEPGTLAASRQLPPDTRIWSTNVDSYCMVPHCQVESVVSFKMSDRLDEILGGSPDHAKQLLQQAGLNYFLFSTQHRLLDMLPYSQLFDPKIIGDYLGLAWTDGATFLLTWKSPDIAPLGEDFLEPYRHRVAEKESPWFQFRDLIRYMQPTVARLRSGNVDVAHAFPWRNAPSSGIQIVEATYGRNCRFFRPPYPGINMFRRNNAGIFMRNECRGRDHCTVPVSVSEIGDPAQGCGKDFSVVYQCAGDSKQRTFELPGEANGQNVELNCSQASDAKQSRGE